MITKQTAQKDRIAAAEAQAKPWEEKIDRALIGDAQFPVHIDARGMSSDVRRLIIERYAQGGWKVSYTSDQRDGDFLKFE